MDGATGTSNHASGPLLLPPSLTAPSLADTVKYTPRELCRRTRLPAEAVASRWPPMVVRAYTRIPRQAPRSATATPATKARVDVISRSMRVFL